MTITLVSGIPLSLASKTKTNEATVTSTTPDSNLSNNKDSATVTITAAPPSKLQVRKSADPVGVVLNGSNSPDVVFTIVLKVASSVDAKQVDVCDTLPAQHDVRLGPGRDVQQRPRLLAPRPRQGGIDHELQDHRQRRQELRGRLAQERRGRDGRQCSQGLGQRDRGRRSHARA